MKVCLMKLLTDDDFKYRDVEKLRGYISNLFKEEILLHNHLNEYEFRYKMPKIQYKLINNKLCILGFEEGITIIKDKLLNLKEININNKIIKDFKIELSISDDAFEIMDELYTYEFLTPWLALNQDNHIKYINGNFDLNKQLQNNILSNFKDCNITVTKKIMVKGNFSPIRLVMKDTAFIGFKGNFICNVKMPNYMGIGKRKSIGYGTILSK